MKHLKNGSSIIEVVIATTLISMGVLAALSLAGYSQRQNSYSKSLNEATSYNNQAADYLRSQKAKLGWVEFLDKFGNDSGNEYCLMTLPDDFASLASQTCENNDYIAGTTFIREMEVSQGGAGSDTITITIRTSWMEKVERISSLTMELTQWQ